MNKLKTRKRQLWGELTDGSNRKKELKTADLIGPGQKLNNLKNLQMIKAEPKATLLTIESPLVTQVVEVMNQTEIIKSLVDTYTHTNGTPTQLMNTIEFPPENLANLVRTDKYRKPFGYVSPKKTNFSRGVPVVADKINKPIVTEAIRKSLAGLLRLKGFDECTESAMVTLADGVDEFYKCLLGSINNQLAHDRDDRIKHSLNVMQVERGYYSMCNTSLLQLHNYYKNEIVRRCRDEQQSFHEHSQKYDKLVQESQYLQKRAFRPEDYMSLLDFANTTAGSTVMQSADDINMIGFLDGENANVVGLKEIFDQSNMMESNQVEENLSLSVGPPASISSVD